MKFKSMESIKESYAPIFIESGTLDVGKYSPPTGDRSAFITARAIQSVQQNYSSFSPLNNDLLIHLEHTETLDYYPEDMKKVLQLFLSYWGNEPLYVLKGFSSPLLDGFTAHSAGLAIDLLAKNAQHARKICNAAYRSGIGNIVMGGDFSEEEGYVHLDIAPKDEFYYDGGFYDGPWT